ncbi:MAG: DUF1588 domain-containing protein [Planctomycetes bacterium]|nr:DUF1588 domain-containing protein [Planctomycetota bacterium]
MFRFALPALALVAVFLGARAADPPAGPTEFKFETAAQSKSEFDKSAAPFLTKHCAECHNAKNAKGDLDLAALDPDMKATTSGARWAMVVEKLATGEMPPKGKPRPADAELVAVGQWAHAEAKRAGRPFTRRAAYANGNAVPHHVLFDPKNVPPFDGGPRVRRLSPEIYAAFTNDLAKGRPGIGQPFSPEGKSTFKDMGAPKMDEPVTAQLIQNALAIVELQTAYKVEDGQVKGVGFTQKEFLALFDPKNLPTDVQLEAAVAKQFDTILKRQPTAEEKARFVALMKKNITDAGQTVGVRYALAAVLLLPEAVFRMEVGAGKPDAKGRVRLAPREIAFALAYALTDKRPDAELLKAAATGELDTDAGVAKQVRRLLDDPKTDKTRILRFIREYFGYDAALEVFKDSKDNPEHDARVLIEDTDRLVLYVLEQDRQVLKELLTTNKSFVAYKTAADTKKKRAEELAKFEREKAANPEKFKGKTYKPFGKSVYEVYGLKDFPDTQPVELPAEQRAGILTQPAWLVAQSTSFDNHAIHRGKWVRERLLGGVVPDVPITVDAQLPDAPHKTLRERMAVTQQEYCWKCHRLMNDVGYPFEQFDHFGRFRTAEKVLDPVATEKNKDPKGKPLGPVTRDAPQDATGLIAHVGDPALDGPVKNVAEYMKRLASSERVEQVFVRHAFRYWTSRNESPGDAATLQAAHKAYRDSNGSMKALIVSLLSSESFLYRVPPPESNK